MDDARELVRCPPVMDAQNKNDQAFENGLGLYVWAVLILSQFVVNAWYEMTLKLGFELEWCLHHEEIRASASPSHAQWSPIGDRRPGDLGVLAAVAEAVEAVADGALRACFHTSH